MIRDAWLPPYRRNWALLRVATDEVGAMVEGWPYAALDRAAEHQPVIERLVAGRRAHFTVECIGGDSGGELHICVDAHGGPPTLLGVKPSYVFYKRPDGTVHYGHRADAPAP